MKQPRDVLAGNYLVVFLAAGFFAAGFLAALAAGFLVTAALAVAGLATSGFPASTDRTASLFTESLVPGVDSITMRSESLDTTLP